MGVYQENKIVLFFEEAEDRSFLSALIQDMVDKSDGDFFIHQMEDLGTEYVIGLSSPRAQNADWQQEQIVSLIRQLVREGKLPGMYEVGCSATMDAGQELYDEDAIEEWKNALE